MAYKRKLSQMEIEETMQNFNIESDLEDSFILFLSLYLSS